MLFNSLLIVYSNFPCEKQACLVVLCVCVRESVRVCVCVCVCVLKTVLAYYHIYEIKGHFQKRIHFKSSGLIIFVML